MIKSRGRGAPSKKNENMLEIILSKKDEIIGDLNKIVPITNKVWSELSELCNIKPKTIHAYVVTNNYGLRDALLGDNNALSICECCKVSIKSI